MAKSKAPDIPVWALVTAAIAAGAIGAFYYAKRLVA